MARYPAEEFSSSIGEIYECALNPSLWPQALTALRERLAFLSATLAVVRMPSGDSIISAASGVDARWLVAIAEYSSEIMDQWGGAAKVRTYPLEVPMVLSAVNPDAVTPFNRYHREICLPRGVIDSLSVGLLRDQTTFGAITFTRHHTAGPIGKNEIEQARLFIPHVTRAVTINHLLEARTLESATYEAVLDGLNVAVLLVARDLKLVYANLAGEMLLRSGRPLRLRSGRLSGPTSLTAALATAAASEPHYPRNRGFGIPALGEGGEEFVLHVLPLAGLGALQGATAAIFVAPSAVRPVAPLVAIASLFDLTPTETRVLELLIAGRTNDDIAATLGIAISTVRTHLLRIFEKTRTHRQGELIRLIASFSLPIG